MLWNGGGVRNRCMMSTKMIWNRKRKTKTKVKNMGEGNIKQELTSTTFL